MEILGILISTIGTTFLAVGNSLNNALGSSGVGLNNLLGQITGLLGLSLF